MIHIFKNILDNKTKTELNKICNNFDNENYDRIDYAVDNHYNRLILNNSILLEYLNNCQTLLNENLSYDIIKNIDFKNVASCINKVTNETNKDDPYHFDISYLTLITYLNDDFQGGEFVYKYNKKEIIIQPTKDTTLLMDNRLLHKVMPVSDGIRFSLITFFKLKEKKDKTLM